MALTTPQGFADHDEELISPLGTESDNGRAIRLLLIEPARNELGLDEDTISCRIEHHSYSEANWVNEWKQYVSSLDHPVQPSDRLHWRRTTNDMPRYIWGDYFALSYTWGSPENKATILLDGHEFKVTRNLEDALRSLRDCKVLPEQGLLWVDALCINQDDLSERASEVQRMQSIYVSAVDSIVYLGSGDPATEAGIEFINIAGRAWNNPTNLHKAINQYLWATPYNIWDQVTGLITLQYWWRQWVLQEMVAGTDEKPVLYGRSYTVSKWIWQVFNCFERRNRHTLPHGAAFWDAVDKHPEHLKQSDETKRFGEFGGPIGRRKIAFADDGEIRLSTYQILTTARKNSATNRRDYVYGLLGIFDSALSKNIKVDYTATVEEVYTSFALAVIQTEQSLEILGQCDLFGSPTWTPRMDVNSPWYRHIHSEEEPPYNANAGRKAAVRFELQPSSSQSGSVKTLHTCAVLLDRLDGLSSANLETDFRNENQMYQGGYADQITQTSSSNNAYGSEDGMREGMWRVASGNREVRGAIPAPNAYSMLLSTEVLQEDFAPIAHPQPHAWKRWVFKNSALKIAGKSLIEYFAPAGLSRMEEGKRAEYATQASNAVSRFEQACWSRRFSVTYNGYLCLVPWYAQKDDVVAIFPGCSFPVILRAENTPGVSYSENIFKVVSPCYLHGAMDGEIWADVDMGKKKLEDVLLI